MVRPPSCDKLSVKKGIWTAEEDAKMAAHVSKHGTGNWTAAPKKAGLRRCGKSCRLRWNNYLRPDLRHESFTHQEEELIIRLHATIGSRWSIIAQQLPGRTDNDVKNYWNTKLKKKLSEMGIDPVTHKPFSQILADYGNMGCLQKSGSLKRDLKNASPQKFSSINYHFMTTTLSPEMEQTRDSFLNNNSGSSSSSSDNSMELLAQLQAIKFVTEASNYTNNEAITPQFMNEGSFSSSSPSYSSTCSTSAAQTGFCWRDFLLDDAFLPDDLQEQENMAECSSYDFFSQTQSLMPQNQSSNEASGKENAGVVGGMDLAVPNSGLHPSSSSYSSFVDAMIEQENQMFSEFLDML